MLENVLNANHRPVALNPMGVRVRTGVHVVTSAVVVPMMKPVEWLAANGNVFRNPVMNKKREAN